MKSIVQIKRTDLTTTSYTAAMQGAKLQRNGQETVFTKVHVAALGQGYTQ